MFLQDRRPTNEHVKPEVIACRHLVGQPAQVPVFGADLLGKLLAAELQLLDLALRGLLLLA